MIAFGLITYPTKQIKYYSYIHQSEIL
jgi:hypothetical protein